MANSYRPDYGPSKGSQARPYGPRTPMYHFQGNRSGQSNDNRRPPSDFTFRAPQQRISERPLLRLRQTSPENSQPSVPGESAKYRDISEMTDSEAEDMDFSDVENEAPVTKRPKVDDTSTDQPTAKWSNPDPYTALPAPPADEPTRKRTDVVKLIRKARVAASSSENADAMQTNQDFISFDFNDPDTEPPPNAPTEPRAHARSDELMPKKRKRGAENEGARAIRIRGVTFYGDAAIVGQWRAIQTQNPTPWYQESTESELQMPLMSLHREILDFYSWVKPHDFEQAVRSELIGRLYGVLERLEPGSELQAFGSFAAGLYLPTADMDLVLLTKEHLARRRTGIPLPKKPVNYYHKMAKILERAGIPTDRCTVIPRARVPILKFVDKLSGVKVDLSFDNDTGINANATFQVWKARYPAMPIIVSIIKQFLMIRGLNDNAAGGLGGFSTICLVTSIIQHLPPTEGPPNLGRILLEFFNFYGNLFNKRELGIRMEPPGYFVKRSYKPFVFNPSKADRLSIIDPNNFENDISGGSQHVDIIFKAFAVAFQRLRRCLETLGTEHPQQSTILGELIGGNYAQYTEQRDRLRLVFETRYTSLQSSLNVPPPPPSIRPPPPEERPQPPASLPAHFPESTSDPLNSLTQTPIQKEQNVQKKNSDTQKAPKPKKADVTNAILEFIMTASTKRERLARRMSILRPDLLQVPASVSMDEAVTIGGYANTDSLTEDLNKRQTALTALRRKKKAGPDHFPELVGVRRVFEKLQRKKRLPTDAREANEAIRNAHSGPTKK